MRERTIQGGGHGPARVVGADMPLDTRVSPIEPLLSAFARLARDEPDARLLLTGRRCPGEIYSVWNEVDRRGLGDRVEFTPYYERCERFSVKKPDCDAWVSRHTPGSSLSAETLGRALRGEAPAPRKYALFFTPFHPMKQEGNSTLMRLWLDHLRRAGYIVHVAYYMYDTGAVSADMRRAALREYDLYREIPVSSRLTGANYNGLNLHVDDWCGAEAMDAVGELASRFEYDIAITNYPWMSAVFGRVNAYTRTILLTHDSFVDRNRRMLAQGYPESGWMSIEQEGERLACERSDIVVAMQEHEAQGFREMVDPERVRVIGPVFERVEIARPAPARKLRIGYFGSSNWVNEQNLGEYLRCWDGDDALPEKTEVHIAGGVCETLKDFVPRSLLARVNPVMVGRVGSPAEFFSACDLVINPERGGTGIKIKTLEAMAHGCPIITTAGGSVGIGSRNRHHQAEDFAALAEMTKEFIDAPEKLDELRRSCVAIYDAYVQRQRSAMNDLLGEPIISLDAEQADEPGAEPATGPAAPGVPHHKRPARIPDYVRQTAADYHLEEFERFIERVDVRGKRVLEIGSDYHLASTRLFMANGAKSVVANNLIEWKSDEPLPGGVEFIAGDACDLDLPEGSFDIVYGIAIVEHVPDFERLCRSIKRLLRPGGVVYLQGCPMWPGNLGHHVWCSPDSDEDFEANFAKGGGKKAEPMQYSFTDNNPIPDWAHVTLSPAEMELLLIEKGIPAAHADRISRYVYHLDTTMVGSCTNFLSASQVLGVLGKHFDIEAERISSSDQTNEYFDKALAKYSEEDLRTLGLRVWMTHKGAPRAERRSDHQPKVSIVIPFYKVEPFIEGCLRSVMAQDYANLEAIFVDDASPDASRGIVERYAVKDDRIRLVTHAKNQGLGPARNTGVAHATGEYLLFLDSDDYFSNRRAVSTLVRAARERDCTVVVGSCERVMADGRRVAFDRDFDAARNGRPGEIVDGQAAYLGASFIPGGQYVPMRAWGTLIDRFVYLDSGLEYPPAEHEDLPHTPFLYFFAGRVLYLPDVVVTYRDRSDSISNTGWDSGKIGRQGLIWRHIKANVARLGLERHLGDTAVKTAEHLIMKLRQNGIRPGAEPAAFDVLEEILQDAKGDLNEDLLFYTLDSLRGVLDFHKYDYDLYHRLTSPIPSAKLVRYYRRRLGTGLTDMGPVPISGEPDAPAASLGKPAAQIELHTHASGDAINDKRAGELIERFRADAPPSLRKFPSMLTEGDFALYFDAGRNHRFEGTIVDAGCFVGGTTMSLVQGLLRNPLLEANRTKLAGLIRVYDLFEIDDHYIREHLERAYPDRDFTGQDSFLGLFRENLGEHMPMLDVRPGDVMSSGYPDQEPIEILGVDLCKAPAITDFVVREFFPRLMENALVIQQDFIHPYHPHIHLSMMLLRDRFRLDVELRSGGSLSYRLVRPITPGLVLDRFGSDAGWYSDVPRNERLLRTLVERMYYDENRWVMLQVLGWYYWAMGEHDKAHAVYHEALDRYPHYEMPAEVRRYLGAQEVVE